MHYRIYINGAFSGHANTINEAMAHVSKWAYNHKWKVIDGYQKVVAQG